jgi:hypothetical protein
VPLPFKLLGKLPHWVRMQSPLADQDTVVNAKQVGWGSVCTAACCAFFIACALWCFSFRCVAGGGDLCTVVLCAAGQYVDRCVELSKASA